MQNFKLGGKHIDVQGMPPLGRPGGMPSQKSRNECSEI